MVSPASAKRNVDCSDRCLQRSSPRTILSWYTTTSSASQTSHSSSPRSPCTSLLWSSSTATCLGANASHTRSRSRTSGWLLTCSLPSAGAGNARTSTAVTLSSPSLPKRFSTSTCTRSRPPARPFCFQNKTGSPRASSAPDPSKGPALASRRRRPRRVHHTTAAGAFQLHTSLAQCK